MSLYSRGIFLIASVTNIQWGRGVKKKSKQILKYQLLKYKNNL